MNDKKKTVFEIVMIIVSIVLMVLLFFVMAFGIMLLDKYLTETAKKGELLCWAIVKILT